MNAAAVPRTLRTPAVCLPMPRRAMALAATFGLGLFGASSSLVEVRTPEARVAGRAVMLD